MAVHSCKTTSQISDTQNILACLLAFLRLNFIIYCMRTCLVCMLCVHAVVWMLACLTITCAFMHHTVACAGYHKEHIG